MTPAPLVLLVGGTGRPLWHGTPGGQQRSRRGSRQVHGREPAGPACGACAPGAERARPRTSEEPTRHARAGRRGRRGLRHPQARGGARKGRGGRKPAPPVWIAAGPRAPRLLGFCANPVFWAGKVLRSVSVFTRAGRTSTEPGKEANTTA